MKIKNLKIYKKLGLFVSGAALCNFCLYEGYVNCVELKPFEKNEYKATKIEEYEISQNNIEIKKYYSTNTNNISNAVLLKTPYLINDNDEILRKVYFFKDDYFTEIQLKNIKENINNQEYLFTKSYVIDLIDVVNEENNTNAFYYENSELMPSNNNYELSYLIISDKKFDYIYKSDSKKDAYNNIVFSSLSAVFTLGYSFMFKSISEKKDKSKKLLK